MERRRILVHRPNSTSTHSCLTGGQDVATLYHGLRDLRTWSLWTSSFGDTWRKLFTGIRRLTWKTWQKSFMLLWRTLMQTCYDVCKLVFNDVRLHVGECMVIILNTYSNYQPLSYVSAVFCVGKRCTLLKCCLFWRVNFVLKFSTRSRCYCAPLSPHPLYGVSTKELYTFKMLQETIAAFLELHYCTSR
jgi:hypothetical protein